MYLYDHSNEFIWQNELILCEFLRTILTYVHQHPYPIIKMLTPLIFLVGIYLFGEQDRSIILEKYSQ
jgi:hypothetical protein